MDKSGWVILARIRGHSITTGTYFCPFLNTFLCITALTWTFFTLSVDKARHFLNTYPPHVILTTPRTAMRGISTDYLALFMIFFIADEYITHARPLEQKHISLFNSIFIEDSSVILMILTITCDRNFSDSQN